MDEGRWLADRFEKNRTQLRAVAYRMLGSVSEADDAVQETWLRLSRSDAGEVENLAGWLRTVVARICLDMLRSRTSRREEPWDDVLSEPAPSADATTDPEHQAVLADSVGPALLVVLETLSPAERLAFVLHDLFGVPFDEIVPILERSPEATRQLASRARRRVRGAAPTDDPDLAKQRAIVDAFLAASRDGDLEALVAVLAPDVVLRADTAAAAMGAAVEARGAAAVAETFLGRARAARPALVDRAPGLVWVREGRPQVAFRFSFANGAIVGIELVADPVRLGNPTFLET